MRLRSRLTAGAATVLLLAVASLPLWGRSSEPGAEEGSLARRLEQTTRPLLGVPYAESPLGEGEGVDPDPRFRLDAFDCTTFVETAMALALGDSGATAREWLDRIRYQGGVPGFERRRHLIAAQWFPGLNELGLLEDVTTQLGVPGERRTLHLTEERWRQRRVARELELPEEAITFGAHHVEVLSAERFVEIAQTAPPAVISVVRVEWVGAPILVTHQALLLRGENGEAIVRHASQRRRRVVDETPSQFASDIEKARGWPVAGLNVQRIVPPD